MCVCLCMTQLDHQCFFLLLLFLFAVSKQVHFYVNQTSFFRRASIKQLKKIIADPRDAPVYDFETSGCGAAEVETFCVCLLIASTDPTAAAASVSVLMAVAHNYLYPLFGCRPCVVQSVLSSCAGRNVLVLVSHTPHWNLTNARNGKNMTHDIIVSN